MIVDVLLPSALFLVGVTVVFLYCRVDRKVDRLVGGQELHLKHVLPLVLAIGVMVTVVLAIPEYALLGLFLFAYTAILLLFTFLFVPRWYLALVPPALFLLSFFYWWNIFSFNFFAIVFGISVAVYMGRLFTWKTTAVFAALVTVMDIIQVLITGHMGEAFETAKTLGLPAFIQLPMFPTAGLTYLGLGDLFQVWTNVWVEIHNPDDPSLPASSNGSAELLPPSQRFPSHCLGDKRLANGTGSKTSL
jgi:hypothetical protein